MGAVRELEVHFSEMVLKVSEKFGDDNMARATALASLLQAFAICSLADSIKSAAGEIRAGLDDLGRNIRHS
jgi:hypothetical protein